MNGVSFSYHVVSMSRMIKGPYEQTFSRGFVLVAATYLRHSWEMKELLTLSRKPRLPLTCFTTYEEYPEPLPAMLS